MDVITKFKQSLDTFPKKSSDINIICSITYAEYKAIVTIMNTLLMPQAIIKRELTHAVTALNNTTYNNLIEGFTKANTVLKSVLPEPFNKNMAMTLDIGRVGNMLTQTCADFLGSVPESLFNIFQDIQYGLMDLTDISNDIFELPFSLSNSIANSLLELKDNALKDIFGSSVFSTFLSPFIAYEEFLLESGINEKIKKLETIENCMSKPGICNRPRRDFIEPTSKMLYSLYFKKLFFINTKSGKVDINSFLNTFPHGTFDNTTKKTQLHNILNNMRGFRLSIK